MTISTRRPYPRPVAHGGASIELRLLDPARAGEAEALLAFAQRLPVHDLLFLRRDIAQPKVVAAWLEATKSDAIVTVLAVRDGASGAAAGGPGAGAAAAAGSAGAATDIVGCATIVRDVLSWSSHVGEMRVIVDPALRGAGLGQVLTRECFALAVELGVEKLTAQMTVDQRGAIELFEGMGFKPEALLADHVKGRDGKTHDIVVLAQDVGRFLGQQAAYGVGPQA